MFKLQHNYAHLTHLQSNAQYSLSQALIVCKPGTSNLDLEKAEEPEIKLPTSVGSQKKHRVSEKHLSLLH